MSSGSVCHVCYGECVMLWPVCHVCCGLCHVVINASYTDQCVLLAVVSVSCWFCPLCDIGCGPLGLIVMISVSCRFCSLCDIGCGPLGLS